MEFYDYQGLAYGVEYPKGFEPSQVYPVLLFLHGAGTRGSNTEKLVTHPFREALLKHEGLPFVTVVPLCSKDTWFDMWERLEALCLHLVSQPYVDKSRFYLMGASMGGYAVWQLAMSMPELFAAIVPICGGGMYWNASRLKTVPVWAFHGALDPVVLPEESQKMVDKINKKGGSAKLTVYPNNGHDAWSDTFANPEVFAWLLSHRRDTPTALGHNGFDDSRIYG